MASEFYECGDDDDDDGEFGGFEVRMY